MSSQVNLEDVLNGVVMVNEMNKIFDILGKYIKSEISVKECIIKVGRILVDYLVRL